MESAGALGVERSAMAGIEALTYMLAFAQTSLDHRRGAISVGVSSSSQGTRVDVTGRSLRR